MKKLILIPFLGLFAAQAQIISVKKTFNNAVVNQTNNAIYNEVNKGVSSVFSAPGKIFRKIKANSEANSNGGVGNQSNTSVSPSLNTPPPQNTVPTINTGSVVKAGSSDFVSGTNILLSDNFSSTTPGSFPDNWMTNSSGEVRTLSGEGEKWLQISANGIFAPNQINNLPDNFTLEFDAIFHPTPSKDVHYILYLYSIKDKVPDFKETSYPGNAGIYFAFNTAAGEIDAESFEGGKPGIIDLHQVTDLLKSELANKVHVSISRQKSKLTLYINGSKVFSSPNAMPSNYTYNAVKFGSFFMGNDDFMLISNLVLAGF